MYRATTRAAEGSAHRCIAGSEAFVCELQSFHYDPEENIPLFHLPKHVNAIRFVKTFYGRQDEEQQLNSYDGLLHKQLNSPIAIEIARNSLERIEIPSNLEYADFKQNEIKEIYAASNQSYALRFLNLYANTDMRQLTIANISKFVNLETLYLGLCNMYTIPEGLFDNMDRLKVLDLRGNHFSQIDLSRFPPSLTELLLEDNRIVSLNFPTDRFPMLTELNVEDNFINNVDVSALLAMAPKLKLFAVGHNPIKRAQLVSILDELVRRNVAYYNTELPKDSECLADERKFRGVCIPESSFPLEAGDWVEIVLLVGLLIVVLVGGVFFAVKLWAKFGLFLLLNCVVGRAELNTHKCLAGSETFVCTLPSFHYNPEDNIPKFDLPEGVNAIQFVRPLYYTSMLDTTISMYDALLHKQLNSPKAIEIIFNRLTMIEIPPNLEYGDFMINLIQKIYVSSNQSYALRYLNLSANHRLRSISTNISRFENLETLYMRYCGIRIVPGGIFENMNRLKRLDLTGNDIKQIDLSRIPPSLTALLVKDNGFKNFQFPSGRFPLLTELNVEDNLLNNVDVSAILAMAPKLKLFAIAHNPIKRAQLVSILDELDRRNVAYYNMEVPEDSECLANERKFRGVCIPESSFPLEAGDWVEIVLLVGLLIVVLVGIVFGGVKLWKKYHPSWEVVNYFNRQPQERC
ncbi:AGAP004017-PA-like protein [Anopheles sinensis]|uniref:AGAP004017-PA-like protein n=1 Tax=Anopheles sinensis TaxID=74873 RepID=A0A084VW30_ANOSI|nr:AGAP004017-PA-like protein [Anopheles sinensis]